MIEIKKLSKTYSLSDGSVEALKNVSLTIPDGDIYGIIGMSGAGKSTLVRCINMLERPTCGQVIIDGQDLTVMSEKELRALRQSITMIFQGFNLLMQKTCLKNVCFPLELAGVKKGEATKRAMELLELVGLQDKAQAYPAQLSGGQQQRVAIARALALHPDILCFDEPTSALDPELTGEVLRVLRELADRKTTMIIVTHEMHFARDVADRILFMDGGVVVEEGPAKQLIDHPREQRTKQFLAHYAE